MGSRVTGSTFSDCSQEGTDRDESDRSDKGVRWNNECGHHRHAVGCDEWRRCEAGGHRNLCEQERGIGPSGDIDLDVDRVGRRELHADPTDRFDGNDLRESFEHQRPERGHQGI